MTFWTFNFFIHLLLTQSQLIEPDNPSYSQALLTLKGTELQKAYTEVYRAFGGVTLEPWFPYVFLPVIVDFYLTVCIALASSVKKPQLPKWTNLSPLHQFIFKKHGNILGKE